MEVSVDRCDYCNPWERIRNPKDETIVTVVAGDVRRKAPEAEVVADPIDDNPAHAIIRISFPDFEAPPPPTKAQLKSHEIWERYIKVCEKLASLATPLEDPLHDKK